MTSNGQKVSIRKTEITTWKYRKYSEKKQKIYWHLAYTNNIKQIEGENKEGKFKHGIILPKIYILSKNMSRYQINILFGSFKFTLSLKRNVIQQKNSKHNYTRKLCLAEFFHATPENNFSQNIF